MVPSSPKQQILHREHVATCAVKEHSRATAIGCHSDLASGRQSSCQHTLMSCASASDQTNRPELEVQHQWLALLECQSCTPKDVQTNSAHSNYQLSNRALQATPGGREEST